jgi:hypothetical protein
LYANAQFIASQEDLVIILSLLSFDELFCLAVFDVARGPVFFKSTVEHYLHH